MPYFIFADLLNNIYHLAGSEHMSEVNVMCTPSYTLGQCMTVITTV